MKNGLFLLMSSLVFFSGCAGRETTQDDLKKFFASHRVGHSPDYAIVKNGDDYLITIHGYMDDLSVCLDLIKPLNDNPRLSIVPGEYKCVPLNN